MMKTMKKIYIIGLVIAITALIISGCKSTEIVEVKVPSDPVTYVPLTPLILHHLHDSVGDIRENIAHYQLFLSGRVSLENDAVTLSGREQGGGARLDTVHVRTVINIPNQTEGQAINIDFIRTDIILSVGFESDDKYHLEFSASNSNHEEYFHLVYQPVNEASSLDHKGFLHYGGKEPEHRYKLRYSDMTPYLLIQLSQSDTERLNERTARGRRVN